MALLILAPALASADEFDITMSVVGADESFDESITNRISLPFGKGEARQTVQQASDDDAMPLERLERLLRDQGGTDRRAEASRRLPDFQPAHRD